MAESKVSNSPAWRGFLSVTGELASDSAIQWPRLKTSGADGRRTITRDTGNPVSHKAVYFYDDHRLPFGLCAVVGDQGVLTKPWAVFAAVRHSLRDSRTNAAGV